MVFQLHISEELEKKLVEQAKASGKDTDQFLHQIVERALTAPTLDEVLAPFRDEVEKSGVSDHELDELVEQAREARFRERRNKST